MSTLLKKKGAASFKPRAPVRRPTTAPPSKPPSVRPSIERESQPPVPSSAQDIPVPSVERVSNEPEAQAPVLPEQPAVTDAALSAPPSIPPSRTQTSGDIPTQAQPEATSELPAPPATVRVTGKTAPISPRPALAEGTSSVALPSPPSSIPTQAPITNKPPVRTRRGRPSAITAQQAPSQEILAEDDVTVSDEAAPSPAIPANDDILASTEINDESRDLSVMGAGESDGPSEIALIAPFNPDGTSGTPVPAQRVKATVRARKRKIDDADIDIEPTIEGEAPKPKAARKTPAPRKPRKPRVVDPDAPAKTRRKRAETPEDAEEQEIDHSTVKMAELCRDLKIGKKFSKHEEIKRRDLERKAKAKLRRENPELVQDSDEDEWRPRVRVQSEAPPADVSLAGPRMRLVDGQIVIDETSLNLDRHKLAAATAGVMEIVEENEFSRITTSGTYMKREKNVFWDMEAEEKFYNGLRMFGTDFEMISMMFKDRSRRHIKLKFNKEERLYPSKINSALLGEKVPIDFEEYKSHTGLEYEDVAVINAEREEIEAEQNAEEARIEAELAETIKQKKAAIHGIGGGPGKENEEFGGIGNAKSRKKGKAKKNKASVYGGGEDVEILGDI